MKKSILFLIFLTSILVGCATPQVTVTSEVTITLTSTPPSPTDTPIPTPTATSITANLSATDKQIFDAAPEIEEIENAEGLSEKVWNDVYGTALYMDESGGIAGYWEPNRFNKDKGVFRKAKMVERVLMVGEEGKEKAVWPVKAKMELPGNKFDGVTIFTSPENWENNQPIGREDMADMSAYLIALINDKQIRGFADGAVQLGPKKDKDGKTYYDYKVGEGFITEEAVSNSMIDVTTAPSWKEKDKRPFTPAVFPAEEYEGLLYMPQMFLQADQTISNIWYESSEGSDKSEGATRPEKAMEYALLAGGHTMLVPAEYRNIEACMYYGFASLDFAEPECQVIMANQEDRAGLIQQMVKDGFVPREFSDGTYVFTIRFHRIPGIR